MGLGFLGKSHDVLAVSGGMDRRVEGLVLDLGGGWWVHHLGFQIVEEFR